MLENLKLVERAFPLKILLIITICNANKDNCYLLLSKPVSCNYVYKFYLSFVFFVQTISSTTSLDSVAWVSGIPKEGDWDWARPIGLFFLTPYPHPR